MFIIADMVCLGNQLDIETYDITPNDQLEFKKIFTHPMRNVVASLEATSIQAVQITFSSECYILYIQRNVLWAPYQNEFGDRVLGTV